MRSGLSRFGSQGPRDAVQGARDGGDGLRERPERGQGGQTEERAEGVPGDGCGEGCGLNVVPHHRRMPGGLAGECGDRGPLELSEKGGLADSLSDGCAHDPGVDPGLAHEARGATADRRRAADELALDLPVPGSAKGKEVGLREVKTVAVSAQRAQEDVDVRVGRATIAAVPVDGVDTLELTPRGGAMREFPYLLIYGEKYYRILHEL